MKITNIIQICKIIKKLKFETKQKGTTGPADPPARPSSSGTARSRARPAMASRARSPLLTGRAPRSEEQRQWENSGEWFLTVGGPSDEAEHTVMLTTPNHT
jgi:hypothetical protein